MTSRVKKYRDLHEKISMDAESNIDNSDLSHFANRLNQIDEQFDKMESQRKTENVEPTHARQIEKHQFLEKDQKEEYSNFDTFESAYLKDFLDEVKEYNVKKGYRNLENTDANILSELNVMSKIAKPFEDKVLQDIVDEVENPIVSHNTISSDVHVENEFNVDSNDINTSQEEKIIAHNPLAYTETRLFRPIKSEVDYEEQDFEKTIAMAVQEMAEFPEIDEGENASLECDHAVESSESVSISEESLGYEIVESDQPKDMDEEPVSQEILYNSESLDDEKTHAEDNVFIEEIDDDFFKSEAFRRELLEQTQTMQHKIVDHDMTLGAMTEKVEKTDRMLHAVLSLLILAIIVVSLLIASIGLKRFGF